MSNLKRTCPHIPQTCRLRLVLLTTIPVDKTTPTVFLCGHPSPHHPNDTWKSTFKQLVRNDLLPCLTKYAVPCAVTPSQAITVEASALVPTESSGDVWTLTMDDGMNGTHAMGVFSAVDTNWTTASYTFAVEGGAAASYVGDNGEVRLSVSCSEPDSTQVGRFEHVLAYPCYSFVFVRAFSAVFFLALPRVRCVGHTLPNRAVRGRARVHLLRKVYNCRWGRGPLWSMAPYFPSSIEDTTALNCGRGGGSL